MSLNPPSGNMYPWAYTTNPIGGRCQHECSYCYVGRLRQRGLKKYDGKPFLDEKWFKLNLKIPDRYILFVQSCGDLFGSWIPDLWIRQILERIREFPETTFLLQTKNPIRFLEFNIPKNCILGTTIETNRDYKLTKAPSPKERFLAMKELPIYIETMISNEPVIDFDLAVMLAWMGVLRPKFVSVGADSGKNNLLEPSALKLKQLLWQLELITEVRRKKNLNRLLKMREAT